MRHWRWVKFRMLELEKFLIVCRPKNPISEAPNYLPNVWWQAYMSKVKSNNASLLITLVHVLGR